uniref:Uncharacterized protein n=1 Tax=Pseudonaja textilis TaxID=8673 RepID=A0A670Z7D4_PSETE
MGWGYLGFLRPAGPKFAELFSTILTLLFPFAAYYRFLVLFFNCLLTFGSYFCFDIPSVLQEQFQGVSVFPPLSL